MTDAVNFPPGGNMQGFWFLAGVITEVGVIVGAPAVLVIMLWSLWKEGARQKKRTVELIGIERYRELRRGGIFRWMRRK